MKVKLMLALGLLTTGIASAQDAPGKLELDRASIQPGVERLSKIVQEAITASGGDLNRSQIHWVLAFSTGHYKTDPLGAQAVREFATQFIKANAVQGDQVTSRAWEMNTWEYRNASGLTLQIGTDPNGDKASVSRLWPTTPQVGSVGGHDTEQTAVTLTSELAQDPGAVLILLTNTAASVGAAGTKLLGTNAPDYQEMLQSWNRVAGTQDGASVNLPYTVHGPGGDVPGQMQAVVFVPKTFSSAPIPGKTREEQLNRPEKTLPTSKSPNVLPALLGLLLLGGGGVLAWKMLGNKGGSGGRGAIRIGDTTFSLRDLPNGRPFCVLAGPGYRGEDDTPVVPLSGMPAAPIAEFIRSGRDIRVRALHDDIKLTSVGDRVSVSDSAVIPLSLSAPDVPLEFRGEVRGSGGVPKEISKTVTVSYLQGEV